MAQTAAAAAAAATAGGAATAKPPADSGGADKAPTAGATPKKRSQAQDSKRIFMVHGHNGIAIVESIMERLGWSKAADKASENWKLCWAETKGMLNYTTFREGQQLVNHIPNCELICNKLGLLVSLREHERVTLSMKSRQLQMQLTEFFPETYVLDYPRERQAFFEAFKPGEIWINKPTGLNQGKGIFLVRDADKFKEELQQKEEQRNPIKAGKSMGRIVQRYIMNPLLIQGRKFDIRAYLLIASTAPFLVLFHHGYLRLSIHKYSPEDANLCTHLTNQYIQKKDERYGEVKDDTVWSMDQFNDYLNSLRQSDEKQPEEEKEKKQTGPPEENWVFGGMERQMKAVLLHLFGAVKHRLTARLGYFELFGVDFMIDDSYKLYLIEVNTNPAMHLNCNLLNSLLPPLMESTIKIALECFEKSKKRQSLLPLKSAASSFQVLHCSPPGSGNSSGSSLQSKKPQRSGSSPQPASRTQPPRQAGASVSASSPGTQLRRQVASPNVLPSADKRQHRASESGSTSVRKLPSQQRTGQVSQQLRREQQQKQQQQKQSQQEEQEQQKPEQQQEQQQEEQQEQQQEQGPVSPRILLSYDRLLKAPAKQKKQQLPPGSKRQDRSS